MSSELPNTSSTDGKHLRLGLVGWLDRCWRGFATALSAWQHTAHLFITEPSTHPYSRCFHRWWEMRPCMKKPSTTTDWRKPWDLSLVHTKHTHIHTLIHTPRNTISLCHNFFQVSSCVVLPGFCSHHASEAGFDTNKRFSKSLTGAKLRTNY